MLVLFDVGCIAFLLALLCTPFVRDTAKRYGLVDQPDHGRKIHEQPVPRLGGIAVAFAYSLSLLFLTIAPYQHLNVDVGRGLSAALAVAPAVGIVFATGLIDDIRGLKPWHKLILEVIAAVWVYRAGYGIEFVGSYNLPELVSIPVTVIWLVGCTNALNLIDGMDGLATGVGVFAALTSLVAALVHGTIELALVTVPLVGALLGFLRYNFNPASIFLGDSGSLLIGFLLGLYGVMWSQKSATILGMTAPLMALAMPLLDTAIAIVRRFLRGKEIFSPDRGHIHHKLLDQGLTPRRAALLLYGACAVAAVLSILHDLAGNKLGGLIVLLFCVAAWVGLQHLGYAEFGVAGKVVLRGLVRGTIDAQLRLQQFERALGECTEVGRTLEVISSASKAFGLEGVCCSFQGQRIDTTPDPVPQRMWQVRVPLPEGQYVNLFFNPQNEIHPAILPGFARLVEEHLGRLGAEAKGNAG